MNDTVVYTAIFGDYDDLIEPSFSDPHCDYVCFTDQESIKSNFWKVIYVKGEHVSQILNNRMYKMMPHLYLNQYKFSMYIDSNIRLLSSPLDLVKSYIAKYSISCPEHEHRDCIYEEASECIRRGKANRSDVEKQMAYYEQQGFPHHFGLREMNIIIRCHNDENVIKLMNEWWDVFNAWSKRDQLSFYYAVWRCPIEIGKMKETSRVPSKYFFLETHKHAPSYQKLKRMVKRFVYAFLPK